LDNGIYFLANDRVKEQTIAFLNSFRHFNPTLPLCLIPYDRACQSILKLSAPYEFAVYEDENYLKYCDTIGDHFCHLFHAIGTFRKLALWNGPFENFIHLDIDTVVFKGLDFLFESLKDYDYLSASQGDVPQVWNDSVYTSKELTPEQISYSCNTGFILSHKRMFSQDDIRLTVESARGMKKHMCRDTHEQPLLNYLIVKSNKKYDSIYHLFPSLGNEWAGVPTHQSREDVTMTDSDGRELLFLHWAGFEGRPARAFDKFREGVRSLFDGSRPRKEVFPYRKIWEHYRFLRRVSF